MKSPIRALAHHVSVELSLVGELEDEVDGEVVLEVVVELDYVGVVEEVHYADLGLDVLEEFGVGDGFLLYLLYGVCLACLLMSGLPHHSE